MNEKPYVIGCMQGSQSVWWWIGGESWRGNSAEAKRMSRSEAYAAMASLGNDAMDALFVVREDCVPFFVSWHEHMRLCQGALQREHQAIEAMERLRVFMDGEIVTVPDAERVEALEKAISLRWTQQVQSYAYLDSAHKALAMDAEREAKELAEALDEREEWQCRAKEADRALLEETRRGDALKRQIEVFGGELEAMKNRAANAEQGWTVAIRDLDAVKKERDALKVELDGWMDRADKAEKRAAEHENLANEMARQRDRRTFERDVWERRAHKTANQLKVALEQREEWKDAARRAEQVAAENAEEHKKASEELASWRERAEVAEMEQAALAERMAKFSDACLACTNEADRELDEVRATVRKQYEKTCELEAEANRFEARLKEAIEQRDRAERAIGFVLAHLRQLADVGTLSTYEAAVTLNLAIKSLEGVSLDSAEQGPAEPPDNVALVNEIWGSGKGEEIDADVGCLRKDVDGVLAKVSEHSRSIAHFQDKLDRMLERLARLEGRQ